MIRALMYVLFALIISLCNIMYTKYEIRRSIKIVDVNTIIDEHKATLYQEMDNGSLNENSLLQLTETFITNLETTLKNQDGIVIISKAVLSGGNDVTEEIKNEISR